MIYFKEHIYKKERFPVKVLFKSELDTDTGITHKTYKWQVKIIKYIKWLWYDYKTETYCGTYGGFGDDIYLFPYKFKTKKAAIQYIKDQVKKDD